MKKYLHFWLFGPEFGCVKRQLIIIRHFIETGTAVVLVVHPRHVVLMKELFNGVDVIIKSYKYSLVLEYDRQFNFRLGATISGFLKWFLYRWYDDWHIFLKITKDYPPKLIIHDFLPYVAVWAKLLSLPAWGIYNYCLQYTSFGKGFIAGLLQGIVPALFRLAYRLSDKMFVESFVECTVPNATVIPVIRRYPEGVINKATNRLNFFLALGGKSDPRELLDFFSTVHAINPQFRFWIAPRSENESLPENGAFEIVRETHPLELGAFWEKVDGVICKAGYSTVAEALQFGRKLFILPLTNHPEIQETAHRLLQLNLAKEIHLNQPAENIARVLQEDFHRQDFQIPFGGEKVIITELEKFLGR